MKIRISGIENTPLNEKGLIRVIRRYCKCENDIFISFQDFGNYGDHVHDGNKHQLFIYVNPHVKDTGGAPADTRIHLLDTILHELRHAVQAERWDDYLERDTHSNHKMDTVHYRYKYSKAETDARAFALRNVLKALEVHDG